tara:strand:+ start:2653 stop:4284 length:1632 start_codon:yes stop_codon:yes gene_type:complete
MAINFKFNIFVILSTIITTQAQPDSRFRPFDWVLYRSAGAVSSITEGYSYAYLGTITGGIHRFNIFSNNFSDPITVAQGLKSNSVTAIHFDHQTGILWTATPGHIQYSYTREGDWISIPLVETGLSRFDRIERIGSSKNYIWLKGKSIYVKLDHSSGTVAGIFPYPDELKIQWSSGPDESDPSLKEILMNYSIMSGWMITGDYLIDHLGRTVNVTTGLVGRHGDIWIGCSDGTLLQGKSVSEIFYPISTGPFGLDVGGMALIDEFLWLGGLDYVSGKGISWLNLQSGESFTFEFDALVNMSPTPIYSIWDSDQTIWAGGQGLALVYDKGDNYWRTLGVERGVPDGKVWDIVGDTNYVWMGSSSGLGRFNKNSWKEVPLGFEYLFQGIPVYDLNQTDGTMWIGSRSGLFIFNQLQPQLRNALEIGSKEFSGMIYNVRAVKEFEGSIYACCDLGIIKFNQSQLEWELLFPAAYYHSKNVYSMALNRKYLFLGTEEGLVRINKKTGFIREYFFPFIGRVNKVELEKNIIWLGTSNGLLKFKWTRES